MMNKKNDPLREKTLAFAIRVVNLCKYLTTSKKEFVISNQLLRSGTNPGAMTREAAHAESPADFIHKLSVALKEIGETQYWLELLFKTDFISEIEYNSMMNDAIEIEKIIKSSILTKKQNMSK